jgi:AcrR family transcriptional regulator
VDLEPDSFPTRRRRGPELENALLDAAWDELLERGYSEFTFESVAERAGTSRPVLYRRWKTKVELVLAAVRHNSEMNQVPIPDTGSLRGDVISLLEQVNSTRFQAAALITIELSAYFKETGTAPWDLRSEMLGDRPHPTDRVLIERAMDRGEIPRRSLPRRVISLPFDLARHELLMNLKPLTHEAIIEIVDDVFLPLVTGPTR